MINYELAKKEAPALKARLTRAKKRGYMAVLKACEHAVSRWDVWGAFPDNWNTWQVAPPKGRIKQYESTIDAVAIP
jgi:hypothetical protein